ERATVPVDVVTGDRDLFQLIDDDRDIRVLYTARGVTKLEVMDAAALRARYGIAPAQYADFATLRGDPSDGLPGVPGIGEKTAASLLARFGTLDALLDAAASRDPHLAGVAGKLNAARDHLTVAPRVGGVPCGPSPPPCRPGHLTRSGCSSWRNGGGSTTCSADRGRRSAHRPSNPPPAASGPGGVGG